MSAGVDVGAGWPAADSVRVAVTALADAQQALADACMRGAVVVAERQEALVRLLDGAASGAVPAVEPEVVVEIDWETRRVQLRQRMARVVRVSVNGTVAMLPHGVPASMFLQQGRGSADG